MELADSELLISLAQLTGLSSRLFLYEEVLCPAIIKTF